MVKRTVRLVVGYILNLNFFYGLILFSAVNGKKCNS